MTAVVAKVAGVPQVVLATPPAADGNIPDSTLAAAAIAGVDEVYRIGGAQAVAALAYGTETIDPVDVIVGPGNVYVAIAKREVAQEGLVGVPSSFAGPSEVVVVADGSVDSGLRRHRRHRAGRARSRRTGLADLLGARRWSMPSTPPSNGWWRATPAGVTSRRRSPAVAMRCSSTPRPMPSR